MMKRLILRLLQQRGLALIHSAHLEALQEQAGRFQLAQDELERVKATLTVEREAATKARTASARTSAPEVKARAAEVKADDAAPAHDAAPASGEAGGLSESSVPWEQPGTANADWAPDGTLRFSICIPTRERHVTLRSAIETVLAQTYGNFELIIQDNASSPATRAVVQSFSDPRIRYFRSEQRLAMHDNWEEALRHATGDYILFIGDDDAVMPDCLERAREILVKIEADVLSWPNHLYYWPDVMDEERRNLLVCDLRSGGIWRDGYADDPFEANISRHFPDRPAGTMVFNGRNVAKAWYAWRGLRLYVPLYHNLIARRVVEKVRARCGRYFVDYTPDFSSLAANCYFAENIVFYSRCLSMSGHSGLSNGGTHGRADAADKSWATFLQEAGIGLEEITIKGVPPLKWAPLLLYGCLEHVRQKAFPDDTDIPNGIADFIKYAAAAVSAEPESHRAECRQWVLDLAARYGVNEQELTFSETPPYKRPQGAMNDPAGRIFYVHVDGRAVRLGNIVDAVRVAHSMALQEDQPITL